ncbi:MAG TPA: hypothetical protein DEP51_04415 [Clostridiales bacterium]|nr:hypothetical protein [Clostridiales bacterium]
MASNPMQRQARNYFLLGMVITLLIAGAVLALLFMQMRKIKEENKKYADSFKPIYVLNQNIKSGDVLDVSMFTQVQASESAVPADYVDPGALISAYSLYTKEGVKIITDYSDGAQHLYLNGDKSSEVLKDEATGKYYVLKNNNKEYIETVEAPVIAKVDAKANTILSQSLIARSNEIYTDDARQQEYNMVILPVDLVTGDYVDIRMQLPSGQDYIVVSKKRVTIPDISGEYLTDTIKMNMAEDEILSLSCAIVEAYKMDGTKLYATKYVDAGLQQASIPTYVVNNEVARLMDSDANIVEKAKNALYARYNSNNLKSLREQYINAALSQNGTEEEFKTKAQESITSTKESRQKYLQSLTATPAVPTAE